MVGSTSKRAKKIRNGGISSFIPEDIVANIVSRLEATDVIRCRKVCKGWRTITSSRRFLDMHARGQQAQGIFPLILVEKDNYVNQGYQHFFLEKWWGINCTKTRVQKFNFPMYNDKYILEFSLEGLIVLKDTHVRQNYIILNPINGESIKIGLALEMFGSQILGVFFDPSLNEYCTIWRVKHHSKGDFPSLQKQYKLLILGHKPCWRNITNKCTVNVPKYGIQRNNPLSLDNYIYWLVYNEQGVAEPNSTSNLKIMAFDINSTEMTLMPPPPVQGSISSIKRLMNNDGMLSMVEVYHVNQLLVAYISTLTNRSLQIWTKARFCFNNVDGCCWKRPLFDIEPITLMDKQIVFNSDEGIFVCNSKEGTIRKFGRRLGDDVKVISHIMTLASLKGCKAEFYMGRKGEVAERFQRPQCARIRCSKQQR